ncbi:MAG: anti-sigma factor antagonist [Actinomycetota bacterium]
MSQMSADLQLEVHDDGAIATVRLIGELDISTAERVRNCFGEVFASGRRRLVVDLSQLDFIDSTGLGVMVAALKRFRSDGGEMTVADPAPRVRKVFELTRLDTEFSMT